MEVILVVAHRFVSELVDHGQLFAQAVLVLIISTGVSKHMLSRSGHTLFGRAWRVHRVTEELLTCADWSRKPLVLVGNNFFLPIIFTNVPSDLKLSRDAKCLVCVCVRVKHYGSM